MNAREWSQLDAAERRICREGPDVARNLKQQNRERFDVPTDEQVAAELAAREQNSSGEGKNYADI